MPLINSPAYKCREIDSDELRDLYAHHYSSIRSEGLTERAEIAAELAYRDAEIKRVEQERADLTVFAFRLFAAGEEMHDWYGCGNCSEATEAAEAWEKARELPTPSSLAELRAQHRTEAVRDLLHGFDEAIGALHGTVPGDVLDQLAPIIGRVVNQFKAAEQGFSGTSN